MSLSPLVMVYSIEHNKKITVNVSVLGCVCLGVFASMLCCFSPQ